MGYFLNWGGGDIKRNATELGNGVICELGGTKTNATELGGGVICERGGGHKDKFYGNSP